jgi:hypothetical protein
VTKLSLASYFWRHAVGTKDHPAPLRNILQFIHKNGSLSAQLIHDMLIVYDFLTNIEWSRIGLQGDAHDVDGPNDTGTKTARTGQ